MWSVTRQSWVWRCKTFYQCVVLTMLYMLVQSFGGFKHANSFSATQGSYYQTEKTKHRDFYKFTQLMYS